MLKPYAYSCAFIASLAVAACGLSADAPTEEAPRSEAASFSTGSIDTSCLGSGSTDPNTIYLCIKQMEKVLDARFVRTPHATVTIPEIIQADPSKSTVPLCTQSNLWVRDATGTNPVYELNAEKIALKFTVKADPNKARKVVIAVQDDAIPYQFVTGTSQIIEMPKGNSTQDVFIEVGSPPTASPARSIYFSIFIDDTEFHCEKLYLKHQPTGVGAFTIPALPVHLVYAPDQNQGRTNSTTYEDTTSMTTTIASSFTSTSVTSRNLPTPGYDGFDDYKSFINTAAGLMSHVNDPTVKGFAEGLTTFLSLLGHASVVETDTKTDKEEHVVVATTADTYTASPGPGAELGVGDTIYLYQNARVAWAAHDGKVSLSLLGAERKTHYPMRDLVRDYRELLGSAATCPNGTDAVGTITSLACGDLKGLLDLDPYALETNPILDPSRFTIGIESSGTASGSICEDHDVLASTETTTTTTSAATTITDYEPGFLAIFDAGVLENIHLNTTTTLSNAIARRDSAHVKAKYCLDGDQAARVDYAVAYDKVFGSFLVTRLPEHAPAGNCAPPPDARFTPYMSAPLVLNQRNGLAAALMAKPGGIVASFENAVDDWTAAAPLGGGTRFEVVGAPNADGRLSVFSVAACGPVWMKTQIAANGAEWTPWQSLEQFPAYGQSDFDSLAVTTDAGGRIVLFARRGDGSISTRQQVAPNDERWTDWTPLPGATSHAAPAAARASDGRVQLFAVKDATISVRRQLTATVWTSWQPIAGAVATHTPAVAINAQGLLEVFALGPNKTLLRATETHAGSGTYGAFVDAGGALASVNGPSALRNADGSLEVVAASAGFAMTATLDHTPATFAALGGLTFAPIALRTRPDGAIGAYSRNVNGYLEYVSQTAPNAQTFTVKKRMP